MRNRNILSTFLLIVSISLIGCQQASIIEDALQQGKLALANEELEKAKNHFQLVLEEDENHEEALQYIEIIELAEQFVGKVSAENIVEALDIYEKLEEHSLFEKVTFYIEESKETLDSIIEVRKELDDTIKKLQAQFESEKLNNFSSDDYVTEIERLLDEKFVTEEQVEQLEKLKASVEDKAKEQKEAEERKKAEEAKRAQEAKEAEMIEEMDRIAERDQQKLENALTPDSAYDVAYDFVKNQFPADLVNNEHTYLRYEHEEPTTEHFVFHYYSLSYKGGQEKITTHSYIFVDPIEQYAYEVEYVDY